MTDRSANNLPDDEDDETLEVLALFKTTIEEYYRLENEKPKYWYPMFSHRHSDNKIDYKWVEENYEKFIENTPNKILQYRWYNTECGYVTALEYTDDGDKLVVGHANGLIQMRHGHTGVVLATLRNIQFPPKPIYAIQMSPKEERICYAACTDGVIYRVEIPNIDTGGENVPEYCIRADPALEWINTIFYGSASQNLNAHPFINQRSAPLALGITADGEKMIAGFSDTSVKVFDMKTQETLDNFKVHKLRLQFIPKKLQRFHAGQVCAVRSHRENPLIFATAGWDSTFRVWDTRCRIGCMMTFEDVNIVSDAIDINRQEAVTGSWRCTEALSTWDLTAKKRIAIIRVQNRRPDVDGEYVYACRYWRSKKFNRKGKYAIIGGSGTGCVEVINLHNRYITGLFPAPGTVLALTSYEDRIAYGGTAPIINIVSFHDPKHEKYELDEEEPYDYSLHPVTLFETHLRSPRSSVDMEDMDDDNYGDEDDDGDKPKRAPKAVQSTLTDVSKSPLKQARMSTINRVSKPPDKS